MTQNYSKHKGGKMNLINQKIDFYSENKKYSPP